MPNGVLDPALGKKDKEWVKKWGSILRLLSALLDELRADQNSIREAVRNKPPERFARWQSKTRPGSWTHYYELSSRRFYWLALAACTPTIGIAAAASHLTPPPTFARISVAKAFAPAFEFVALRTFAPLIIALDRNIQALIVDHQTINQMLLYARSGNDSWLFKAIGYDPAVLSSTVARQRLATAGLTEDDGFFRRLGQTLIEPPKREDQRDLSRLNASLMLLMFARQLPSLSKRRAAALFIEETRFYPDTGKDPAGSLWRHVQNRRAKLKKIFPEKMSSSH